jgi:uncharacterized metal-binding protein
MNCLACKTKSCRKAISCGAESFDLDSALQRYHEPENQRVIQTGAHLVDGGRAGSLSRMQEIVEFVKEMQYTKIGLAYCYGMETLAEQVRQILASEGIAVIGVSCTVGAFRQNEVNEESSLPGVSCSPLNQAAQLNAQGVDLAIVIGLCMGHDVLFNRQFAGDVTTLVVKDRVYDHAPVKGIVNY